MPGGSDGKDEWVEVVLNGTRNRLKATHTPERILQRMFCEASASKFEAWREDAVFPLYIFHLAFLDFHSSSLLMGRVSE